MTARQWKKIAPLCMETIPAPGEFQFTISRFNLGDRIAYGLFRADFLVEAIRGIDPNDEPARAAAIAKLKTIAESEHVDETETVTGPRRVRGSAYGH